ncbi:hypothetical protein BB779_04025 [Pseudomonas viridiflava]|nr:hypothetical protein BB779_04025 [Pseudomonas viridiflava]
MDDLTQDVRHVLRRRHCKHQKTIIWFELGFHAAWSRGVLYYMSALGESSEVIAKYSVLVAIWIVSYIQQIGASAKAGQ